MRRLQGAKPRRFKDHRRMAARRWAADYGTIAERYPPRDALGREVVALAADMLADYRTMRITQRGTASARRKAAGLFLGALRVAADGANGHGHTLADALRESS